MPESNAVSSLAQEDHASQLDERPARLNTDAPADEQPAHSSTSAPANEPSICPNDGASANESPARPNANTPANMPTDADALARTVLALHEQRYNCAQSVACAFAPLAPASFDEDTLFALMEGFGGGMGGGAETCGAATGGVAIIGALCSDGRDRRTTKMHTYPVTSNFIERFRAACGTTCCRELKDASPVPTPHRCDAYMETAAKLLLQTLEDHKLI